MDDVELLDAVLTKTATILDGVAPGERDRPTAEFRSSAAEIVSGWRTYGVDRTVGIMRGEMPGQNVLAMTITEYLAHGWDLATATNQSILFTDTECAQALSLIEDMLPPQYRGDGQPFGEVVSVPDDASAVDRFVAFLGRDPH